MGKTEGDKEKKEKDPKDKKDKEGKEKKDKEGKEKKEKKDKEGKEKKDKGEKGEKKVKSKEKTELKITSLERKLHTLKGQLSNDASLSKKYSTTIHGLDVRCDKDVRIRVGPIIGKVTSTTAIVVVEVTLSVELAIHVVPAADCPNSAVLHKKQLVPRDRPKGFLIEGLTPNTHYNVVIEGVNAKDATARTGSFRTISANPTDLKIVALSCDRPERLLDGETNMWAKLANEVKAGKVDVVLHLGDQVYGQKEFTDAQAVLRYSGTPRGADAATSKDPNVLKLHKLIKTRLRDIYRFTWNLPGTADVLAHTSNLMIWSDNDIYNDFTIAKEEGHDGLEPIMIHLAHQVYREYQRQLWDVDYENATTTDEFHSHRWGNTGVFIIDMRGNRITGKGEQRPENPVLNDAQWDAFQKFIADPELKNLIICSEIPFVGDTPEVAKANSKKPGLEFLVDHWAYNETELNRLFELAFDWKAHNKDERDVVFVGGDIHVGVTSTIRDSKTGLEAIHLTATPISNHVCGFFPALEGKINDRFSYSHVPLKNARNYGLLEAKIDGAKAHIAAQLIAGEPCKKH